METVLVRGTDGKGRDIFFLQRGSTKRNLAELRLGRQEVMGLAILKTYGQVVINNTHRIGNEKGRLQEASFLCWVSKTRMDFQRGHSSFEYEYDMGQEN